MQYIFFIPLFFILIGLLLNWLACRNLRHLIDVRTGKPIPVAYGPFYNFMMMIRAKWDISWGEHMKQTGLKYGPFYGHYFFGPALVLADPEDVRTVLKNIDDFPKTDDIVKAMRHATHLIGPLNIVQSNHEEWHGQRSMLNKAFTSNSLFFQPILKKVNLCVSKWENKPSVCVGNDLKKLTIDVLATCIFGMDFDTLSGNFSEPLEAYHYSLNSAFHPLRFLFPLINTLPGKWNEEMYHNLSIFDQYIWGIMDQTKKRMQEKKESQPENSNHLECKTKSLIELMYESTLPEATIRDNVSTFFIAGHETTANSLSWLVAILVTHPEIQQKARQEILDKASNELTYDTLKELTFIDGLLKEGLRRHPPIPLMNGRYAKKDSIIGNVRVPAGTYIDLNHITMANDPKIWVDPTVIRPERWFPENLTKEQRNAWTPFSGGPRICIGMNLSLLEQKLFVVSLLKKFKEIKLDPQGEITPIHPGY
jgi:cytochrome P450